MNGTTHGADTLTTSASPMRTASTTKNGEISRYGRPHAVKLSSICQASLINSKPSTSKRMTGTEFTLISGATGILI